MTDWREPALPLDEPPQGYREVTHWLGCDALHHHPDCHHPSTRILLDLIAELREDCVLDTWDKECITHGIAHDDEDGGRCPMGAAADRAEARLREVQGE